MTDEIKKENNNSDENDLISKQEVWDVLAFARALAGSVFPNVYSPFMLNERLKDISYTPLAATQDELNRALADPKNSEDQLRSFVENFETVSMPLKRMFSYMASHLSMDLTYTVKNANSLDEYKSKKFTKDQNILYDYFDRFDHKFEFRNAIKQMLRNELFAFAIREDGEKIVLQELPLQYVKVTARSDYFLLISFDFYYFFMAGVNIDLYPPFFKKKFREIMRNRTSTSYDPSLSPEARGRSRYAYWVDIPIQVGGAFKLDRSLITAIPYFAGLMPDLINHDLMRSLQKNLNMAQSAKILAGSVPLLKDTKASVRDMLAIDPTTLGKFLNLVKNSLNSAINLSVAPLEDMKQISFDGDPKMMDEWLRTMISTAGVDAQVIYNSQQKLNLVDSQLSFESDSKIMEQQLYPQFNSFLEYCINRHLKWYKYSFALEGNDYYLNRQQRFDKQMDLMGNGIVLPQKIAAAMGMKPQTLFRMMQESKAMNFTTDLMTPIIPAFQQSPIGGGGGRPSKPDSQISDAGAETKESGQNITRGGKST